MDLSFKTNAGRYGFYLAVILTYYWAKLVVRPSDELNIKSELGLIIWIKYILSNVSHTLRDGMNFSNRYLD